MAPVLLFVRRGNPRPFEIKLLLKALYLPGCAGFKPALSPTTERAGLLLFPALSVSKSRLLPSRASFWLLPAGSGTFTSRNYSCGLFGMHNVEACNSRALPGYLGLSNTLKSRKTLRSPKPPHRQSSFAAFQHVLDGKAASYLSNKGTLQGSVNSVPHGSVNGKEPAPSRTPVPIQLPGPGASFPHHNII